MRLAFAAISAALDQATMRIGSILIANLLAALLSLPLLLLAVALGVIAGSLEIVILTAVLLIVVLPNPAAAGIHFLVHGFAHQDALLGAADSRYGLRMYAGLACHLWLIGIAGTLVILGNLAFYLTLHMVMGVVLRVLWIYVLVIWLGAHVYVYPLLFEQRVKRGWLIYRSALRMSFTRPFYTVVVSAIWLISVVLMTVTGLIGIFGLGLTASIQHNATRQLLVALEDAEEA